MFLLKELACWIILLFIIIVNTFINYFMSNVLFTLFYVTTYILISSNLISLFSIILLGLIFDSINNINIGISSTILIFLTIINNLFFYKGTYNLFIINQYFLGIVNIIIITFYIKIIKIFLDIPFINLVTFNIIAIICLFILLPIILITNKFLTNAK